MKIEPSGWGRDRLTNFFDATDANIRATFVHKKLWANKLIGINDVFHDGMVKTGDERNVFLSLLMSRSHSAFLAACHLGFGAQCADTYALSRSCLENALTCHSLAVKPDLLKVWFGRHNGVKELKQCREEFGYARLLKCLVSVDANLGHVTDLLYQTSIDMGAHPNERSVTANLAVFQDGDDSVYRIKSLHSDGLALEVSLKTISSAGISALRIFERVFSEHFSTLGLPKRIKELSVGL